MGHGEYACVSVGDLPCTWTCACLFLSLFLSLAVSECVWVCPCARVAVCRWACGGNGVGSEGGGGSRTGDDQRRLIRGRGEGRREGEKERRRQRETTTGREDSRQGEDLRGGGRKSRDLEGGRKSRDLRPGDGRRMGPLCVGGTRQGQMLGMQWCKVRSLIGHKCVSIVSHRSESDWRRLTSMSKKDCLHNLAAI